MLVMFGGLISPALAVDAKQNACPSPSEVITGKSKVTVVEINGIEKNEILAKALENKDIKKLIKVMEKNGLRQELAQAKVVRVLSLIYKFFRFD